VFLPEASTLLRPPPRLEFGSPAELARIERRLLDAERRRSRAAERLRSDGVDVLLDTAPVGPATYSLGVARLRPEYATVAVRVLDSVLSDVRSGRLAVPDEVLYLEASPGVLRRRAARARATHPTELVARHWRVGATERAFWLALARSHPRSVRIVRAAGAPARTVREMRESVRTRPPRLPRAAVVGAIRDARRELVGLGIVIVKKGASSRRPPRR
jgi:hypothetical protein